jgi:hypothetical protein
LLYGRSVTCMGLACVPQLAPKACGHTQNRRVVGRAEAVARIRAAVDARDEGAGILINARSDARAAVGLDEALWRAQAFADEGADLLFIDALQSKEEMAKFCKLAPDVPKMANMLEGGGKTPLCTLTELQDMGFKLVAYPLSLFGVSVRPSLPPPPSATSLRLRTHTLATPLRSQQPAEQGAAAKSRSCAALVQLVEVGLGAGWAWVGIRFEPWRTH